MAKYRKKPVVIEALQYGPYSAPTVELLMFLTQSGREVSTCDDGIQIHTLEGIMTASVGDYIIKGISGEFYPCKPDIFHKTYDAVEDE